MRTASEKRKEKYRAERKVLTAGERCRKVYNEAVCKLHSVARIGKTGNVDKFELKQWLIILYFQKKQHMKLEKLNSSESGHRLTWFL
jgi:hypothetical protein